MLQQSYKYATNEAPVNNSTFKEEESETCMLNKDNFSELFTLIYNTAQSANNYSSECISLDTVRRAQVLSSFIDGIMEELDCMGYCLHTIVGPLLTAKGDYIVSPVNDKAKKELADDFQLYLPRYQKAFEYVLSISKAG